MTAQQTSTTTPRPIKLAHAVLRTRSNYREMIDWYRLVLNAEVVFENEFLAFLTYDDEHHRIAIAYTPDLKERDGRYVGLDHLAFTYESIDDLLATYHRLKDAGIEPFCPINHGPTTSLYYHDPDNNRIELQIDNFEDMADATSLMKVNCKVNPLGVLIDPQEFTRRRAEGESAESLTASPVEELAPPTSEVIEKLMSS